MRNSVGRSLVVAAAMGLLPAVPVMAANIATWSFDAITPSTTTNVVPVAISGADAGVATGQPLGMSGFTNANGLNLAAGVLTDVIATGGASTGASSNAWRVRNVTTNGWAQSPDVQTNGAPQYTQGAEFDASTAGFTGIKVAFDWFSTNQGVKDLQEQYTTDGTNWTNINGLQIATANGWDNSVTMDLTGITAVENNPKFGVRLVSAYDPTLLPTVEYGGASGGAYNNSSGNWRFDNIIVTGTASAVPEPTSLALLALGGAGLLIRRRRAC